MADIGKTSYSCIFGAFNPAREVLWTPKGGGGQRGGGGQGSYIPYIYLYIYMAYVGQYAYQSAGSERGLGEGCGDPPPILGPGSTKKHVSEVHWMVISGYLPLQRAREG